MAVPELSLMNINHRYYSIETFFKAAGEAGYRNIELWTGSMHLYVDCHEHDSVDKIRDLAAQYGIKIVCVCPEQNNPKPWNVAVRGEAGQKRILSYFKNVIDVAVELGAPQILVTSGWAYLDEPAEDAWARSVAMLRSVCDYAETRGIRVALEALQPSESVLVNTAQDVARILADVDRSNLKACIDFGAMEVAGDTIDSYFEALGDKIVHTHFVDVGGGTTHLAWGDGERDMRADLEALMRHGYTGYASAETCDGRYYQDPSKATTQVIEMYRRVTAEMEAE